MEKGIKVIFPGNEPYITTGHKLYMIGAQSGLFPEHGEHLPYEMWGIWAPPIKLWNGFWIKINDELLEQAEEYEQLPFASGFRYNNKAYALERWQFVPEAISGFVLKISLKNLTSATNRYKLALGMHSNLMPVWLGERAGIRNGTDSAEYVNTDHAIIFTDEENTWFSGMKSSEKIVGFSSNISPPVKQRKNDKACYCEGTVEVELKEMEEKTVYFFFGGSRQSKNELIDILNSLKENHNELLKEKIRRYEELSDTAVLSYSRQPILETMYSWTKYINDWIIRDVPGVGKGAAAGYPEFPWWFGNDTNYIVPALLMQGEDEICKETLRLVKKKSIEVNGNGRVVHEISTNGVVYYEGMTTETPQFADTVWQIYKYTGDYEFLKEMYDFCLKGMQWVERSAPGGMPTGYGISEIAGLDCICCDTVLLTLRGYEVIGRMAEEIGQAKTAVYYKSKFELLWRQFKEEFTIEELGIYGDMVATREEIIPRAEAWQYTLDSFPISDEEKIMGESNRKTDKSPEDALEKEKLRLRMKKVIEDAETMPKGSRKAFYLFGLGHSSIPLELGYIRGEEGKAVLAAMDLVQQQESLQIEKMMPIGLGRKVQAYASAKEPQKVLEAMLEVAEGFSAVMPGATSEIYPKAGCFVQAWNSLITMWPYADTIFGIRPRAKQKQILLEPCVCEEMDGISLRNIIIGRECFHFYLTVKNGLKRIAIDCPDTGWDISVKDSSIELVINKVNTI